MNNREVHEHLIVWLNQYVLGVTVIKSHQNAKQPGSLYGVVEMVAWAPIDEHVTDIVYSGPADDARQSPVYDVDWTFQLTLYGAQAQDLVDRLLSIQYVLEAQEYLIEQGLILREITGFNSVPVLEGEVWEPRFQTNIVLRGKTEHTFPAQVIETQGFTMTVERT